MVKGIRLVAGEDIIGRVMAENEDSITLSKPRQVMLVPVSESQMQVSLGPFLMFAKNEVFEFSKQSIVTTFDVSEQMEKQYLQMTTGLVLAGANEGPSILRP